MRGSNSTSTVNISTKMMKLTTVAFVLTGLAVKSAFATVPVYGQCGGVSWTGETGRVFFIHPLQLGTYLTLFQSAHRGAFASI